MIRSETAASPILEKIARHAAYLGEEFERKAADCKLGKRKFKFLNPSDPLHALYNQRVSEHKLWIEIENPPAPARPRPWKPSETLNPNWNKPRELPRPAKAFLPFSSDDMPPVPPEMWAPIPPPIGYDTPPLLSTPPVPPLFAGSLPTDIIDVVDPVPPGQLFDNIVTVLPGQHQKRPCGGLLREPPAHLRLPPRQHQKRPFDNMSVLGPPPPGQRLSEDKLEIEKPSSSSKPSGISNPGLTKSGTSNDKFGPPPGLSINLPPLPPPPGFMINLPKRVDDVALKSTVKSAVSSSEAELSGSDSRVRKLYKDLDAINSEIARLQDMDFRCLSRSELECMCAKRFINANMADILMIKELTFLKQERIEDLVEEEKMIVSEVMRLQGLDK